MDVKELIRIVIEVVESIKREQNQEVVGIFFNKENQTKLEKKINSNKVFYHKTYNLEILPDVLYLDYISLNVLPNVALGLDSDVVSSLIKQMLLKGKKIIVLGFESFESSNEAYNALFRNYYKMLENYGVVFELEDNVTENEVKSKIKFEGKVLTKTDVVVNRECKLIIVDKNTVITDLAKDEAMKKNITISRI